MTPFTTNIFIDSEGLEMWDEIGFVESDGIDTIGTGNLWPGYGGPQDDKCSSIAAPFNSNECKKKCCQKHDNCYTENGCNQSSWLGYLTGANGPCNKCNNVAVSCFFDCDEEEDTCPLF